MQSHRCTTLSRPALRKQLGMKFTTDDAFDAFCVDYFREVYMQFSGEMSRCRKENLLLQMTSEEDLTASLCLATCPRSQPNQPLGHRSVEEDVAQAGQPAKLRPQHPSAHLKNAVIIAVLPSYKRRRLLDEIVRSCCAEPLCTLSWASLLALLEGTLSQEGLPAPKRRCALRAARRRQ